MRECEKRKRDQKGRCGTGVLSKEERGQEGPRDATDRAWFFLALQCSLHAVPCPGRCRGALIRGLPDAS